MGKSRLSVAAAAAAVFIVAFALYANTLGHGFVYDDEFLIEKNTHLRDPGNIALVFTQDYFRISGFERTYRPVVTLSYFLDYALWGLKPAGYHLTNVLLHAMNGVLVFLFALFIFGEWDRSRERAARSGFAFAAALGTALLFAAHPVQTEAAACVGFREDILALLFFLLSFLFFFRYDRTAERARCVIFAALSLILFAIALLSKESAAALPAAVLLFDVCFRLKDAGVAGLIRRRWPVYTGYVAALLVYVYLTRFSIFYYPGGRAEYPGGGALPAFLTMSRAFAYYIKLMLFPVVLNADYVFPVSKSLFGPLVIVSLATLACCAAVGFVLLKRNRAAAFFIFFFFIALLPVSNIIPFGAILAERYLYTASIGFCAIPAAMLAGMFFSAGGKSARIKWIAAAVFLLIMILYSTGTLMRGRVWADNYALWRDTVNVSPLSIKAHNNLGNQYRLRGMTDSAVGEYRAAIDRTPVGAVGCAGAGMNPESPARTGLAKAHNNLANIYLERGMASRATEEFLSALECDPELSSAHYNLGNAYLSRGMLEEAIMSYEAALRFNPEYFEALNNLGAAYMRMNLTDKAVEMYARAARIEPGHQMVRMNMGMSLETAGRLDEAVAEYRKALELNPNSADIQRMIDAALARMYMQQREPAGADAAIDTGASE